MPRSLKWLRILMGVLVSGFFFSLPALAEVIQGQITEINAQTKMVTIQPKEHENFPDHLQIKMKDDAFQNNPEVQSLNDLQVGDQITVEAGKSFFGRKWTAQSLIAVQNPSEGNPAQAGVSQGKTSNEPQSAVNGDVVYGRVISADPATGRVVVSDYASGREESFTVVDANALASVKPGQQVMLQFEAGEASPEENLQAVQNAMQSQNETQPLGESLKEQTHVVNDLNTTRAAEATTDMDGEGVPSQNHIGEMQKTAFTPDLEAALKNRLAGTADTETQDDNATGIVETSHP